MNHKNDTLTSLGKTLLSILLIVLTSCGNAEAKPGRETYISIKIAGVGGWNICEGVNPMLWRDINRTLINLVGHHVPIIPVQDQELQMSGPALSLDNFWSGVLLGYWKSMVPPEKYALRIVILPALGTPQGPMAGGMASGVCERKFGWAFASLKGEYRKDRVVILHELGHLLGAADLRPGQTCPPGCNPKPFGTLPCCTVTPPSIMDVDAGNRCRGIDCQFSAISIRQIHKCLGFGGRK